MKAHLVLVSSITAALLLAASQSFAAGATASVGVLDSRAMPANTARTQHSSYRPTIRQGRPSSAAKTVRVKSGDTLSKIARRHHVSLQRLMQLNNLHGDKANHIKVGQIIRLS